MSTQNSRGNIHHGVGGGNASIDNVAYSSGAAAGFIDDDHAFFANGAAAWVAYIHDLQTGGNSPAITDPANPQFGQGLNHGFAGGGHWSAWLGGKDSHRGVYASSGFRLPDGGLLGQGPEAEIGYKPDYQSNGPTLCIDLEGQRRVAEAVAAGKDYHSVEAQLIAEGHIWTITEGHAAALQLLGGRQAVWLEGGQRIQTSLNMPSVSQLGRAWSPFAVKIDGRWWIAYFSDEAGVVLHPLDNFLGYRIVDPGIDCWFSLRLLASGVLRFALSSGISEQAGQMRAHAVDFSAPRQDLQGSDAAFKLTKITRPLWLGFYEYFAGSPAGVSSPGNCFLAVRGISGEASEVRPAIVTSETVSLISGAILGFYCVGSTVGEIEAAAQDAASAGFRPICYWDARRWPRWPQVPPGSWVCVQLYQKLGESLAALEADAAAILSGAPSGQAMALVPQCYTSNATQVSELRPIVGAVSRIAEAHKNVVAILPFSGSGRPSGLSDHPEVLPLWMRLALDLPEPVFEEYEEMPVKPTIIVKSFAPKLDANTAAKVVEAQIGDTFVTVRFDAQSNLFLDAVNAAGEDHTGAKRHVEIGGGAAAPTPPSPEPTPPPTPTPLPPAAPLGVRVKTASGAFFRLGANGRIDATGDGTEAEAVFEVERPSHDTLRLKASNGLYCCAEGGGGRELIANRPHAGSWETFVVVPAQTGGIALQCADGLFVSPQNKGGGDIVCNGPFVGEWEPVTILGEGVRETGRILASRDFFLREDGSVFAQQSATEFLLFYRYLMGENIDGVLNWLLGKGANMARVLGMVSWPNVSFGPKTPGYWSLLPQFIDYVGSAGLRVEFTVFASADILMPDLSSQRDHIRKVHTAIGSKWNVFLEVANEGWQNGVPNASLLWGKSEPRNCPMSYGEYIFQVSKEGDLWVAKLPALDYCSVHCDRGPGWERKAKDLLEYRDGSGAGVENAPLFAGLHIACTSDEPKGAAERGLIAGRQRSAEPDSFFWHHAVAHLLGAGSTFHSDAGLQAQVPDPSGDQEKCAEACALAWRSIDPAFQRGGYTRSGLADLPLAWDIRFFPDDQVSRIYGRILGNRACCVAIHPTPEWRPEAVGGWRIEQTMGPQGSLVLLSR